MAIARRAILPAVVLLIVALFIKRVAAGPPMRAPRIPDERAASFSLPDLAGRKVALQDFRDRAVLLNFWASWCGPCRAELPALEELSRTRAYRLVNIPRSVLIDPAGKVVGIFDGAVTARGIDSALRAARPEVLSC